MLWKASFPPRLDSAGRARAGVARALEEAEVDASVVVDVVAVLGELASNAARHARTDFTVTAKVETGTLRLEVFDGDTRPPALAGSDSDSTRGRGLHIVAALAADWGWQTADGDDGVSGKVVWAEFPVGPCADT